MSRAQLEALVAEFPDMALDAIEIVREIDDLIAIYRAQQEKNMSLLDPAYPSTTDSSTRSIAHQYDHRASTLEELRQWIVNTYQLREAMRGFDG